MIHPAEPTKAEACRTQRPAALLLAALLLMVGGAGALAGRAGSNGDGAPAPDDGARGGAEAHLVRVATDTWSARHGMAATAPSGVRAIAIGAPEALAISASPGGTRLRLARFDVGAPSPSGVIVR